MDETPAEIVRRHDPDRYLTTFYAPASRRSALFALYALNHELARAREVASIAPLALIRLHWWREVVDGQRKRHAVAEAIRDVIDAGLLTPPDLLPLVDARDTEADGWIETRGDFRRHMLAGAGGLAVAAARALSAGNPARFRLWGAAYGTLGVIRNAPFLARQDRCLLPLDVLASHGLSPEAAIAALRTPPSAAIDAVLADIASLGRDLMSEAPARIPARGRAAGLIKVFAARGLGGDGRQPVPHSANILAIMRAAVLG